MNLDNIKLIRLVSGVKDGLKLDIFENKCFKIKNTIIIVKSEFN